MRLYLATNSEVRLQIRNIQNLINIIFSKYLRFLRRKKTIQFPYSRFVFWFCASISSQLTLGPLLQRNNRRVTILEMAFLCDVMMARMA